MSSDKEEIRWELDKIFKFIDNLIEVHEKEQKTFWDNYQSLHSSGSKARNGIMAGIGFVIGVIISLVSIDELDRTYLNFIVYGFVIAAGVFIASNIILFIIGRKFRELDKAYENDIIELLEFKGWFLGSSIRDKPQTKEQIIFLAEIPFVISQTIGYNIKMKAHIYFKDEKPDIKEYEEILKIAQKNLEHYKKLDLKIIKTIEKFVKEIEKNKK